MNEMQKEKRPSWDEYFMEVCRAIAKRATCDRGKSGCVIAKDHQILATGYVGSPAGLPHCDDVGHEMKKMLHEDGTVTMHCGIKRIVCEKKYHAGEESEQMFKTAGIPLEYVDESVEKYDNQ